MRKKALAVAAAVGLLAQMPAMAFASEPVARPMTGAAAPAAAKGSVLTSVQIRKETAIAKARTLFGIPAEMGEPSVELSMRQGAGSPSTYHLSWVPGEKSDEKRSYRVTVNAETGDILSYHFSPGGDQKVQTLNYTREEALGIAQNRWLPRLAASYSNQIELRTNPLESRYFMAGGPAVHSFYWERMANGSAVVNNAVSIAIDAATGMLISYNLNWSNPLELDKPASTIAAEDAVKAFEAGVPFELVYRWFHTPGTNDGDWRLVYRPVGTPLVSAADGSLIDSMGKAFDPNRLRSDLMVPAPASPWAPPSEPLSAEQAEAMARELFDLAADLEPTQMNVSEGVRSSKPYKNFTFVWELPSPGGKGVLYHHAGIDAINGTVTEMHASWSEVKPEELKTMKPKLDKAGAEQLAIDFMGKFRPDLAGSLRLVPNNDRWSRFPWEPEDERPLRTSYSVGFERMHEGIPVDGSRLHIEIDLYSGKVRYAWFMGGMPNQEKPLPKKGEVISPEAAAKSFLEYAQLRSVWTMLHEERYVPMPLAAQEENRKLKLVYQPSIWFMSIDAATGHPLDGSGRDLVLSATRPEDIKGHWAEREIELLLARGVFEPTGAAFNPDAQVTRGDAARWLVLAKGLRPFYGAEFSFDLGGAAANMPASKVIAQYAEAGIRAGLFTAEELGKEFDPQQPISREEFALWAARAMGYGKVAEMELDIEVPFGDASAIDEKYRNAVGLLAGLNVIQSDNASPYRPKAVLTRAEAAKVLYGVSSQAGYRPFYY